MEAMAIKPIQRINESGRSAVYLNGMQNLRHSGYINFPYTQLFAPRKCEDVKKWVLPLYVGCIEPSRTIIGLGAEARLSASFNTYAGSEVGIPVIQSLAAMARSSRRKEWQLDANVPITKHASYTIFSRRRIEQPTSLISRTRQREKP